MRAVHATFALLLLYGVAMAPSVGAIESYYCVGGPGKEECFDLPVGQTCQERYDRVYCDGVEYTQKVCVPMGNGVEHWCVIYGPQ